MKMRQQGLQSNFCKAYVNSGDCKKKHNPENNSKEKALYHYRNEEKKGTRK
jgi:hypothetical protein